MNEHRVIVTADDFGACDFIDNGIREALKKGVVSSVSALINFPPRDASHPNGEYVGSIAAIKSLLSDLQNNPEYEKSKSVRIGLHLNFHAGSPVSDPSEVKQLLMKEKKTFQKIKKDKHGKVKKIKDKKKKGFKEVAGRPLFKTVNKFNPSEIPVRVFKKELYAQYRKFEDGLGFDPDHLSAHFPVIFMAPKFFREVCTLSKEARKGKPPVPIRNPILVWQNSKKWAPDEDKEKLKAIKKFWKKNSKARQEVDLKTKLANANKLFDIFLNRWRKKNIRKLIDNQVDFPDYTNCNLYGNGGKNSSTIKEILGRLQDFRPMIYHKNDQKPLATEIIVHLGKGDAAEAKKLVPSGINADYFVGRQRELTTITSSNELIKRDLFHYQAGVQK